MGNWRTVYRSANKRVLRKNGGGSHGRPSSDSDEWISTSTLIGGGLIVGGLLVGGVTGFVLMLAGGAVLFKLW